MGKGLGRVGQGLGKAMVWTIVHTRVLARFGQGMGKGSGRVR